MYEATQTQRKLERTMRTTKRKILLDEELKDDEHLLYDQIRLRRLNEEYIRFSKAAGLPTQREREQIIDFKQRHSKDAYLKSEKEFKRIIANAEKYDKIILSDDMEYIVANKPQGTLVKLKGKLSNKAVRKWYIIQNEKINDKIDLSLPLEEQARLAHELRNENRTFARDLMANQKEREKLDKKEPNLSFEEFVRIKMEEKQMTREEVYEYILRSARRTRKSVNKSLGLE